MQYKTKTASTRNFIAVAETKAKLQKGKNIQQAFLLKQLSGYKIQFNTDKQRLIIKRVKNAWERMQHLKVAVLYTVALCITGFLLYGSVIATDLHFAQQALINGKNIGIIKDTAKFESLIKDMQQSLSTTLGKEVEPTDKPVYIARLVFGKSLTSDYTLRQNILSTFGEVEEAYAIYVNDVLICAALNEQVARDAVEKIKNDNLDGTPDAQVEFVESVSIRKEFIPIGYMRSQDGIYNALTATRETPKVYKVMQNDTIWGIANKFAMSVDELYSLNKELSDVLHEGDELLISKIEYILNVQTKYVYKGEKAIPYPVNEIQDYDMPLGKKSVVVAGVEGKKYVVEEITKQNDEIVDRNIISEEILSEPVAESVKVGMKKDLSTVAISGKLARPVFGTISSRYGNRSRGFHKGLDIAAPTGTPIKAADGGTVTFSGWSGGYGYLVKINHGNGYETYYGHCSSISVSPGEKVAKGELIAKVGNTGRSTGPHCHFEVRLNGVAQNPSKYIN
ncbi:MAG: peptidoglycan DD-metalloendopeptidase family protein [Clostridiaceae bacterium]|nr:peptidoglycan DD-metalloendopeptidase family protein [Clostridiaceae bacterium]